MMATSGSGFRSCGGWEGEGMDGKERGHSGDDAEICGVLYNASESCSRRLALSRWRERWRWWVENPRSNGFWNHVIIGRGMAGKER